ncbi:hypothetical protein KCP75_09410 [Salmonella enterica subsp. enterica]|nr:hypothetical protein KCP75_09410 [Salmonella enterica subsp. enterica]
MSARQLLRVNLPVLRSRKSIKRVTECASHGFQLFRTARQLMCVCSSRMPRFPRPEGRGGRHGAPANAMLLHNHIFLFNM